MGIRNLSAMVPVGRFLELSAPTTDIQKSLDFYLRLGFTEITTNDIRPYYYAAVSDGHIVIGLHGDKFEESALTFVHPDVARCVNDLIEAGIEPTIQALGPETFNEVGLRGPDGHLLMMIEARTFSHSYLGELSAPLIGQYTATILRCTDLERATAFWAAAGFTLDAESEETRTLIAPGITLVMDENLRFAEPVLHFQTASIEQSLAAIEQANVSTRIVGEYTLLRAPEGTRIILTA